MRWSWRSRIAGTLVLLAAAQGIAFLVYRGVEDSKQPSPESTFGYESLASRPAPDLVLVGSDGSSRRLGDLRGKAVLLHFWATRCPPCRAELPGLLELGRELALEGGFELVAVTLDQDWADVRSFFGGEIPSEVFQDHSGLAARRYDVSALPDTYFLGADGTLLLRFGGARNWRTGAARDLLERHIHRR